LLVIIKHFTTHKSVMKNILNGGTNMRSAMNRMYKFENLDDEAIDYLERLEDKEQNDLKGGWSY